MFAVVVVFATAAAAQALDFELLLSLLVAGFFVENLAPVRAEPLVHALHHMAVPVFVIFFAMAGAELDVAVLRQPLARDPGGGRRSAGGAIFAGSRAGAAIGEGGAHRGTRGVDRARLPGRGGAGPGDHRRGAAARARAWPCRR